MTDHIPAFLHDWARDEDAPIPSPCISVCKFSEDEGLCIGCYRTRKELKAWKEGSNADKIEILETVIERRIGMGTAGQPGERAARNNARAKATA